jgi:ferredoxin
MKAGHIKDSNALSDEEPQTPPEDAGEAVSREMVDVVCIDKLLKIHEKVRVPAGTVLLDALKQIEFFQGGPCGGGGKCGRCIVKIDDGNLVQSCYYRVTKDITVRKWRGV